MSGGVGGKWKGRGKERRGGEECRYFKRGLIITNTYNIFILEHGFTSEEIRFLLNIMIQYLYVEIYPKL